MTAFVTALGIMLMVVISSIELQASVKNPKTTLKLIYISAMSLIALFLALALFYVNMALSIVVMVLAMSLPGIARAHFEKEVVKCSSRST